MRALLRCIVHTGGLTARWFGNAYRRPGAGAEKKVESSRRLMVRQLFTIVGAVLVAGPACADDVIWRPAAPLPTNLSPNGAIAEPGPHLEPAAKLGPLLPPLRPAPEGTGRPKELPGTVTEVPGPSQPGLTRHAPVIVIPSAEPPRRTAKESFASDSNPAPAPTRAFVPAKVSVQPPRPQPWAPRPGQKTILSDFFTPARPSR